jgi:hypothetical protein
LRIETASDAVSAEGCKCWRGIEQTEVSRMVYVNYTFLHSRHSPCYELVDRAGRAKIETGKFAPESR